MFSITVSRCFFSLQSKSASLLLILRYSFFSKSNILSKNFDAVINYKNAGICAEKAFYTPDHFIPLLYMLGSCDLADNIKTFNDKCLMGAMSMTGYITQ